MPQILISSSDYEGRLGFASRAFADLNEFLQIAQYKGELPSISNAGNAINFNIPENFSFLFLGDAIDHGTHDIRLQRGLITTNDNVQNIIGNRDANKRMCCSELRTAEIIIEHAMLNDLGCWGNDNKYRQITSTCLLNAILDMIGNNYPSIHLYILIELQNNGLNADIFLDEHVRPAQQTAKGEIVTPLSDAYKKSSTKIKELLLSDSINFIDLQQTALIWMLNYTMGCAANNLWQSAWDNRMQEIRELYITNNNREPELYELTELVLDSYTNPSSDYNHNIDYLNRGFIAKRNGNILSLHGCLTVDSFRVPGTKFNIDSFKHIDHWIEAINSAYKKSLLLDDGNFTSYATRFSFDQGLVNFTHLIEEYKIRGETKKAAALEVLLPTNGSGSTIGNNQYLAEQVNTQNLKPLKVKLDQKIVALLKRSGITCLQVGHMPTGNQGLFARTDDGIDIAAIDPTYADQDGTAVSVVNVFDDNNVGQTIMLSRAHGTAKLEYSTMDSEGNRRKIEWIKFSEDGKLVFNYSNEIYETFKDSSNFQVVTNARECPMQRSNNSFNLG